MSEEDFYKIRLLSSKQRLANIGQYQMTDSEKEELKRYSDLFDKMPKSPAKSIYYFHEFLGLDFDVICDIINYSLKSTRSRYYEAKDVFKSYYFDD